MPATIRKHSSKITQLLARAGIESPGLCARVLAAHVAGLDEIAYLLGQNDCLDAAAASRLYFLAGRLVGGEPLAHVLGRREFYGRDFVVDKNVLIPRPETELLVDLALGLLPGKKLAFADLGCGTGCIGISLALERPQWRGLLLDKSLAALAVAKANCQLNGARIELIAGDMFALALAPQSLDLVVSNPPYIGKDDEVMDCVREYEPACALFSENNGLAHLGAIIRQAWRLLRPGGLLLLEHGCGQGEKVLEMLRLANFTRVECRKDLAGLERCCLAWKGQKPMAVDKRRECQ